MQDRRKFKRRQVTYYLKVYDQTSGELIGHLVDISPGGVMLLGMDPCPVGNNFEMKIILPAEILGKTELFLNAECKWSARDINPDYYDSGFQLADISEDDAKVIEWLVQRYGFRG